jgi:Holliday junction resolvasome RuvABC endonuclease subunit
VIAGFDFSTKAIDCVLLDDEADRATWHRMRLDFRKMDSFEKARAVRDVMPARGKWLDEGVVAVGIERPFGHASTVTVLVRIQGAILACLPSSVPVYELGQATWKKRFVGKGGATKDEVRERAWPLLTQGIVDGSLYPQDAADAAGIAYAARQIHDAKTTTKEVAA